MADVELLPLPELPRQVEGYNSDYWEAGQIEEYAADYARACVAHATAALQAEIEALRAGVEASASRAERLEKALGAYQAAVNKIDDLIEYSLPMLPETKAALYAVLANLTATLAKELTND